MSKKLIYRDNFELWGSLIVGCIFIAGSLYGWSVGIGAFGKGGPSPPIWTNWIFLFSGIGITAYSIYGFILRKEKPEVHTETCTDEEVAKAEAEMDAMYLRQYGELPEKPKPEKITPEEPEKNAE